MKYRLKIIVLSSVLASILVVLLFPFFSAIGSQSTEYSSQNDSLEESGEIQASFKVDVVYVNFSIDAPNIYISPGVRAIPPLSRITAWIVLNLTNNNNFKTYLNNILVLAAKEIFINSSIFTSISSTSQTTAKGGGGPGVIEKVELDGVLINQTLVPNLTIGDKMSVDGPFPNTTYTELLENGHWINGVPIKEYTINGTAIRTLMYINGTWTDVTGRINVEKSGFAIDAVGQIVGAQNTCYVTNSNGRSLKDTASVSYVWCGPGKFDNSWSPHESRLIIVKAKSLMSGNVIKWLESGTITIVGLIRTAIGEDELTGKLSNNGYSLFDKQIDVAQETETEELDYIYTAFPENQIPVARENGLEALIKSAS